MIMSKLCQHTKIVYRSLQKHKIAFKGLILAFKGLYTKIVYLYRVKAKMDFRGKIARFRGISVYSIVCDRIQTTKNQTLFCRVCIGYRMHRTH